MGEKIFICTFSRELHFIYAINILFKILQQQHYKPLEINSKMKKILVLLGMSLLISLTACQKKDSPLNPSGESIVQGEANLKKAYKTLRKHGNLVSSDHLGDPVKVIKTELRSIPSGESPAYGDSNITSEPKIQGSIKGVKLYRERIKYEERTYGEQYIWEASRMDSFFTGEVLKGDGIHNGSFGTVGYNMPNPIEVFGTFIPAEGAPAESIKSRVINIPNAATYRDTWLDFMQERPQAGYVQSNVDIQEIKVNREGGFDAQVDIQKIFGGKLSAAAMSAKSHIAIRFVQRLYSVSMAVPHNGILKALDFDVLNGIMPVYVSDIHYGRACYAVVSSNASSTDLRASIDALLKQPETNTEIGTLTGNAHYNKILEEADIQLYLVAGDSNYHSNVLSNINAGSLKRAIAEKIDLQNAAPVAFNLRFVDDNSFVRVLHVTEVPYFESLFIPNSAKKLEFSAQVAGIKATAIKKVVNVYGTVSLKLPDNESTIEKLLLNNTKENPIRVSNEHSENFKDITSQTSIEPFLINLPSEETLKNGFFNSEVTIAVNLYSGGGNGITAGQSLGKATITKPLRDLIFDCQDGYVDVKVEDAAGVFTREAVIRIQLTTVQVDNEYL